MTELQHSQFSTQEFAPWQQGAAFSAYWTYTFVNNSVYYAMIPPYYRPFMQRFVQRPLWWVDGYDPYFHSQDSGILSTRLGGAIVDRLSRKVSGCRIMWKNVGKQKDTVGKNESRVFISAWSDRVMFEKTLKTAIKYAAAAGTSLLKINKNNRGDLWGEAVRFDRFLPSVDASTGMVREVKCFLMTNIDYNKGTTGEIATAYNLIERRYFGNYTKLNGEVLNNVPLVEYYIMRGIGSVTMGQFAMAGNKGERVLWKNLPKNIRDAILQSYGTTEFDKPILLPFKDWLGCELLTWTDEVTGVPQLPFGESVLMKVIPFLEEYDYLISMYGTELYLGRGRVLIPQGIDSGKTAAGVAPNWNGGLDSMAFTKVPYLSPEDQKPIPVQFELRAQPIADIKNALLESIAVNIGISPSTLAPFLNDSSARTAREVSTEENETAAYVAETRAILERPINRAIEYICRYYALEDKVAIRWSQAGLSNPFMTTEMMTNQYNAGLVSLKDAIYALNPDDDDEQVELKVVAARNDYESKLSGNAVYNDDEGDYFSGEVTDDNTTTEPTGNSN